MNRFRPFILVAAVVLTAFVSYGLWTLPKAKPAAHDGFSAERVVKDIEVISREHHSVAHPQERAQVREYLMQRLQEMGADTVRVFRYDSLTGPGHNTLFPVCLPVFYRFRCPRTQTDG